MAYKSSSWIGLAFAVVFASAGSSVFAQTPTAPPVTDLSLDELLSVDVPVVVGASRFAQHVTDAPSAITVITREEIERFGYRTMAEILRSVRGFYVTYDRNYTYLGTRGLGRPGDYNTRVLFLIDGHRFNDNVYDGALIGTEFPIDPDWIERVEIVRGPSSSLYGTSAFFAVVNVITRQGMDATGARATLEVGSLGTSRLSGSHGHVFGNGTQTMLSVSRYGSAGQDHIEFPELGQVARQMDDDEALKVFGSIAQGHWRVQFSHATRDKLIPTGAYGVAFDDPRSQTIDARGFVNVALDRHIGGVTLVSRASYDWYLYDGAYAYGLGDPVYYDASRGLWGSAETIVRRRQGAHLVSGGVEYRNNFRQDQIAQEGDAALGSSLDDRRRSRQWAVFVQDEFTLTPKVILNAGLRHDRYATFGGTTNPRAAVIFKPLPNAALKFLYGRAFRAPNSYELYYYRVGPLKPETIDTTEVVFERYNANGLRMSVSGFRYNADGLITQVTVDQESGDELGFVNGEDVRVTGIEFEGERVWSRGWQALASFTFQQPHSGMSGSLLSNSPRQLARLRVSGPLVSDRFTFGVDSLISSARRAVDGRQSDAFGLANLTVRMTRPFAGLTASFHIDNLLDRRYADPGGEEHPVSLIRQDGRTVTLKASWAF